MYTIYYGCDEWQEVEQFDTLTEALAELERMQEDPPRMGAYPAVNANLRGPEHNIWVEF